MYKLRPNQIKKANDILNILKTCSLAYLKGEVRSGKTLTVLETCNLYNASHVLFITKKKAISSVLDDYTKFGFNYTIEVINYESIHKIKNLNPCIVVYDEAHCLSGFPKPSKRTKLLKQMFSSIPCVLMSGTPAAESLSQYYHQFYVSEYSLFKKYKNFYQWAKHFVDIKEKKIGTHTIRDYSNINKDIAGSLNTSINNLSVIMTQEDAGFETKIKEHIVNIDTPKEIHNLVKSLIKHRAIEGETGVLMAETPAKLQSKVHQIYNGTVILENHEGNTFVKVLSKYKAEAIKERFKGLKICIMYYYKGELEVLKSVFKNDLTECLDEFNTTNKNFALQQSSSEGMNVSKADCLIYYNLGFSGKNYIQSRDRLTIKGRDNNDVYFMVETPGITGQILNKVRDKKDFNLNSFKKEFL